MVVSHRVVSHCIVSYPTRQPGQTNQARRLFFRTPEVGPAALVAATVAGGGSHNGLEHHQDETGQLVAAATTRTTTGRCSARALAGRCCRSVVALVANRSHLLLPMHPRRPVAGTPTELETLPESLGRLERRRSLLKVVVGNSTAPEPLAALSSLREHQGAALVRPTAGWWHSLLWMPPGPYRTAGHLYALCS